MKIFISQKMRDKTHEEILKERKAIEQAFSLTIPRDVVVECDFEYIESYKPELAFKDPITSLSQSLAMLAEADIVLMPKSVIKSVKRFSVDFMKSQKQYGNEFENLRGCEFEFLIAKSYGKKVYTYDDAYNFEEV